MKGNTKVFVTTLGVMVLLTIAFLEIPNVSTPARENMQYVHGDRIFDENGSEIVWRGAGGSYLFHTGDNYQEAWRRHLPEMQAMGSNTIRLAFAFASSTPTPEYGTLSADVLEFDKMDWVLDFLDQHGVKGILDLHNWADMYGDFGSQKLIDNWRAVAQHYRDDPRVVAYELFNEPGRSTWAPSIRSKMDVTRFYAELTDVIREVDPEHIVIWQSQPYVPLFEEIVDLLRPNIVFTFHKWWTNKKWEFDIWTPEQLSYMSLGYAVEYREKLNIPFWFGEFGSGSPFNASNPEWLLTEQHLWRAGEQVVGWNLWMGRTSLDKPLNQYLPFFQLRANSLNHTRQSWQQSLPKLTDYVVNQHGVDRYEPYRIEMWHNKDYVTLEPGIVILVIANRRLADGSFEITSKEEVIVGECLTIHNEECTEAYPDDWNVTIYGMP